MKKKEKKNSFARLSDKTKKRIYANALVKGESLEGIINRVLDERKHCLDVLEEKEESK